MQKTAETAAESAQASAETAKTAAETAKTAAETAKTAAETAETNAETAETNASTHATTATTKASEAATSATSAATSATSASTSATSASTSATAAQTAQTAAEAAQTAAEAAQEAIDGLYLGTATSNPTVDLNGDPVTAGDWYFNTTDNTTRVYDGSSWNTINPDLVGDSSPQLGGDLDLNSNDITGTGNINVTGTVTSDGLTVDGNTSVNANSFSLTGASPVVTITDSDTSARNIISGASSAGNLLIGADEDNGSANSNVIFRVDGSEKARITDDGRLGVNTSNPSYALDVDAGTSNYIASFTSTDVGAYSRWADDTTTQNTGLGAVGNDLILISSGSPQVRLNSSGNLGIGATNPANKLHVEDNVNGDLYVEVDNTSTGSLSVAGLYLNGQGNNFFIKNWGDGTAKPNVTEFKSTAGGSEFRFVPASTERMVIKSGGNVGIGTTSPVSNLEVSNNNQASGATVSITNSHNGSWTSGDKIGSIDFRIDDPSAVQKIRAKIHAEGKTTGTFPADSDLVFSVTDYDTFSEAMRITYDGDVGIGTSSPTEKLHVGSGNDSDSGEVSIKIGSNADNARAMVITKDTSTPYNSIINVNTNTAVNAGDLLFKNGSDEHMRITSIGRVGIGTTTPQEALQVDGNIRMGSGAPAEIFTNNSELRLGVDKDNNNGTSNLTFYVNDSEKARFDANGNLLVGTTSTPTQLASTTTQEGFGTSDNGLTVLVRDGGVPFYSNRLTDDGPVAVFRKDGVTAGQISVTGGDVMIGTGDTQIRFADGSNTVVPRGVNGAVRDAAITLGNDANRWKSLYVSSGVYLGGTGSANLLDDYEEGTWTPVVSDAATGGNTATYTTNSGRYRKVGNMITVSIKLVNIDRTGMTTGNAIYIQGLPFTAGAGDLGQQQGALFCNGINLDSGCRSMCVHTSSSQSYLLVREIRDNQGSVVTNVGKLATGGTADIFATITYFN